VLDRGHIVASCAADELASNERVLQAYLGIAAATTPASNPSMETA
jgi:branched-chain amino acid transport system ATP-binding protein